MNKDNYLSVTSLTTYLKKKFDADPYLGTVYLTGEISNLRPRPNAHQYFSLKDDHAKISAIMFRSAFDKIKFKPEDGMKVLVMGRISLYEATGNYQIYIERMEPDGVGALYQAYEQLKNKLQAEGLFSAPKQALVKYPKRIAVITSPSGAVIKDIMTTVKRRYPIAQLVLFPAIVQGDKAANDLVKRLKQINELGHFDTIIIGRGGGSIEDLWPFNEESVAREIFASQIPIISSVGHETDTTIADLVADVRAATPTAAAELAVPVYADELIKINQLKLRLLQVTQNILSLRRQQLDKIQQSYVFQQPNRLYEGYLQNLDNLAQRLMQVTKKVITIKKQQFEQASGQLRYQNPQQLVSQLQDQVRQQNKQLHQLMTYLLETKKQQVGEKINALDLLSPLKIMGRGYSYVSMEDKIIKSINSVNIDDNVVLHLTDGKAYAKIEKVEKGE